MFSLGPSTQKEEVLEASQDGGQEIGSHDHVLGGLAEYWTRTDDMQRRRIKTKRV